MILVRICCRGRGTCARTSVRAAAEHAAQRSRFTGRDQTIRYASEAWRITEALPRRKEKRS